jgi:hypothetical protein
MPRQSFEVQPVAYVVGGRLEPTDDYWGGTRSIIRIDSTRFNPDATVGLMVQGVRSTRRGEAAGVDPVQ